MEFIAISKVIPNSDNPRYIKEEKFKKLVQSLKDFPEMANARPIVVNKDMVALGGNMRLKAMQEAGWSEVPVQVVDWSEEKQREFIIKDNVGFGEWDWDELANTWDAEELNEWGLDTPDNWGGEELEAEEDDYEMPEELKTDVVLGDLIEIGEHRLLCGDSTDSDQVAKLMDGNKADLLLTDPPYGINIAANPVRQKHKKSDWDSQPVDKSTLDYYLSITSSAIIWGGNYFELEPSKCFYIWDKKQPENFTLAMCEFAWTNINGTAKIHRQSVTSYKKQHPTQKPIELLSWCLSKADGKIIDPFIGSGSTMVAAHQLKRKCYGMELDPGYCQVVIDRMTKLDPTLSVKINGNEYVKTEE
jgi:DNA modification methylase